ncbi:hypothetical protein CH92_00590 [Stutzerimonas stutzeri]|uniref:Uncharacterized protein n=1 Tax=Stutzerimonas stutzeri TaxID=316 RepID=W8R3V5_STUST|nr:hypothetical protein CH92_00590 [Stutzerimonas stutzeri]
MPLGLDQVANFYAQKVSAFQYGALFCQIGTAIRSAGARWGLLSSDLQVGQRYLEGVSDGQFFVPRINFAAVQRGQIKNCWTAVNATNDC